MQDIGRAELYNRYTANFEKSPEVLQLSISEV